MKKRVLIVEDNQSFRIFIKESLKDDFEIDEVKSVSEFDDIFFRYKYSLIILDLKLPDGSGVEVLKKIRSLDSEVKVVILTAYGDIPLAIECIKKGADDFWQKPIDYDILKKKVKNILRDTSFKDIEQEYVGVSKNSIEVREDIKKCSSTDVNVIITGPVGSGKTLVSELIHRNSNRNEKNFVEIDFASLNKNLIESDLFGVSKGAFTGALVSRDGFLKRSDGGTVVLKNLNEVDLSVQGKILKFLDTKSFYPVGSNREERVDSRIISVFSEEPENLVEKGFLRRDLLFRLNVYRIKILPLRERREDIPILANFLVGRLEKKLSLQKRKDFNSFVEKILGLEFLGNVKELENFLESYLLEKDFNIEIYNRKGGLKDLIKEKTEEVEKDEILKTLRMVNWNRMKAAKILKISYRSLLEKIKEYKIEK
uniref:Sigma-54-dependent Fis family transcriptional regulator n=1 Tax=candidate division WOR-3 bacterium TaxID=2052148 RepID=A0A7C3N603_UNCW3